MKQHYQGNGRSLQVDESICVRCGRCIDVCPHAVFILPEGSGAVSIRQRDYCMECGACAKNCPVRAIKVNSGVGCAAAVINGMLNRTGECSCDNSTPCC